MKKYIVALVGLLIITGCQKEVVDPAFQVGNMSVGPLENNTTYFLITSFEWQGEEETKLDSIQIVNQQGESLSPSEGIQETFFMGQASKKSGVYRRNDIGEKSEVEGYTLSEKQKLIMEVELNDVEDGNRNLKITYQADGEEYEKIIEWDTLSNLRTS